MAELHYRGAAICPSCGETITASMQPALHHPVPLHGDQASTRDVLAHDSCNASDGGAS